MIRLNKYLAIVNIIELCLYIILRLADVQVRHDEDDSMGLPVSDLF